MENALAGAGWVTWLVAGSLALLATMALARTLDTVLDLG
jgi:hypothetical protein